MHAAPPLSAAKGGEGGVGQEKVLSLQPRAPIKPSGDYRCSKAPKAPMDGAHSIDTPIAHTSRKYATRHA